MSNVVTPTLLRRRDAAAILGVSESQVFKWERQGLLHAFAVPGIRATRLDAAEVQALATRFVRATPADVAEFKRLAQEDHERARPKRDEATT